MNLFTLVEQQAACQPDRIALIFGKCGREHILTYQQFLSHVHCKVRDFRATGIARDSRVLIMIPMQAELYITLAALWQIGATALFLDPSAGRSHLKTCCRMVPPDALIGIPKARLLCLIYSTLRRIPRKHFWKFNPRNTFIKPEYTATANLDKKHPAILTFTSGSTGIPKGAIRTHGILHAQHLALQNILQPKPDEIDLATMPVLALINLASGITTLIPDADLSRPGFIKAKQVIRQIQNYGATRTISSPALLHCLHKYATERSETLPSLHKVVTGGAPVFPSTLEKISSTFINAELTIAYGSTEAEPISHACWKDYSDSDRQHTRNGGGLLVGEVSPETRLLVIKEQWGKPVTAASQEALEEISLPQGKAGEIMVAGNHVIPGYIDGKGDAENKIHLPGSVWHRTGDAGYLDTKGRLWLLGRCSARFTYLGTTHYPFAIEAAAVETLGCNMAACIEFKGNPVLILPESFRGNIPAQFNVGDLTVKQIIRAKIPLDKRHNAKVNYTLLRKKLGR